MSKIENATFGYLAPLHPQRFRLSRNVGGARKQQLLINCDGFRAHLLTGEVLSDMGDRLLGKPGSLGWCQR